MQVVRRSQRRTQRSLNPRARAQALDSQILATLYALLGIHLDRQKALLSVEVLVVVKEKELADPIG
jgi:hypothetical protein